MGVSLMLSRLLEEGRCFSYLICDILVCSIRDMMDNGNGGHGGHFESLKDKGFPRRRRLWLLITLVGITVRDRVR